MDYLITFVVAFVAGGLCTGVCMYRWGTKWKDCAIDALNDLEKRIGG